MASEPGVTPDNFNILDGGMRHANNTVTSFTHPTQLTQGVTYYFVVTAVEGANESDYSEQVSGELLIDINKPLTRLSITPASASITVGSETLDLTVMATYADNSTATVTNSVSWNSNDDTVATVSLNGVVTGESAGFVTITANLNGKTASSDITVMGAVFSDCELGTSKIGECEL
jgi:hypothetical protein